MLFVSNERAHLLLGGDNVLGAPDFGSRNPVSPLPLDETGRSNAFLYAKHGVQEYWLVDPDARTVTVLQLAEEAFEVEAIYGEGQAMTSPTLVGFTADLNEIFGPR